MTAEGTTAGARTGFGLDHALIAVQDIAALRARLMALGFLNRGFGQHPWGTSTTIFMFRNQLLEVVGIGDAGLLDGYETGGFRFGRHIERHLAEREGVSLSALHSVDAAADVAALAARGVTVTGGIDFGRDVTREDGTPDRTRTRLEVLYNAAMPRLSLFLCQQFRRDLIEYPDWMQHPNGVTGIAAWVVVAPEPQFAAVVDWLARVEGRAATASGAETRIGTERGSWRVLTPAAFEQAYGALPPGVGPETLPAILGIDLETATPGIVAERAAAMGLESRWQGEVLLLPEAGLFGTVLLRFGAFSAQRG